MRASGSALAVLLLACALPARGALGEGARSVDDDRRVLGAVRGAPRAAEGCSVATLDLHGTAVREFLRADGVVFAIAWEGIVHPDLSVLLGRYAGGWRAAREAAPPSRSRRRGRVVTADVIVETWGHMRHLGGRALAPALRPPGVPDEAIR
jgi:hypothetical protein